MVLLACCEVAAALGAVTFVVTVVLVDTGLVSAVVACVTGVLLPAVFAVAVVLEVVVLTERVAVAGTADFALVTMGLPLLLGAAVHLPRFLMPKSYPQMANLNRSLSLRAYSAQKKT